MIPPQLRIQPGQTRLTPEQEAEAERFAQARVAVQLSTEPVDEPQAEAALRHAYQLAGLAPPKAILWVESPVELLLLLLPDPVRPGIWKPIWDRLWARVGDQVQASAWYQARPSRQDHMQYRDWFDEMGGVWSHLQKCLQDQAPAGVEILGNRVYHSVRDPVSTRVGASLEASLARHVGTGRDGEWYHERDPVWDYVEESLQLSVGAYATAPDLARALFFDRYLTPNALGAALARVNEQVSGYWLSKDEALLARRPRVLARDAEARLHSATGPCLEFSDGWGIAAWHGVVVPEQVILAPETLTREDFLGAWDIEVRRIIQERMGAQFMANMGGAVIDSGPRGTLYEVVLPPPVSAWVRRWRVVRYVQVQDASTERQYFLCVPPTIQTAAEAVAWSFQMTVEEYAPEQET